MQIPMVPLAHSAIRGREGMAMLRYWFPAPLLFRWPLAFAIVFAFGGVIFVFARVAPHGEERNADRIPAIYGVVFRLATVSRP